MNENKEEVEKRREAKQKDPRGNKESLKLRLSSLLDEVRDHDVKEFLKWFFLDDNEFSKAFFDAPGARSENKGHHAFKGGLAWHTITAAQLGATICDHYRSIGLSVKRDLVIAGILLHDIGKAMSYEWVDGPEKSYYHGEEVMLEAEYKHTTDGKMLHHIPIGFWLFMRNIEAFQASSGRNWGDKKVRNIGHMILAHHGRPSWSSPVIPQTLEAYIVHAVEMMDAYVDKFAKGEVVHSIYE